MPATAQAQCGPRALIVKQLKEKFHEQSGGMAYREVNCLRFGQALRLALYDLEDHTEEYFMRHGCWK